MPGIVVRIGVDAKNAISNLDKVERQLKRSLTPAQKLTGVMRRMGPAMGAAAAAAGVAAVAIGVDAVQAFAADQAQAEQLEKTLSNLGFADATDSVMTFVDNLQFAANVSEDELRPALGNLIRATGDVDTAQALLKTSLDISAGSGLELSQVTDTLAKAFGGNRKGLLSLKSGLDRTYLSTASMTEIIPKLAAVFGGAADTRAGTLSGSIEGVKFAFGELQESFGKGLTLGDPNLTTGSPEERLAALEARVRAMQPAAQQAGEDLNTAGQAAMGLWDNLKFANELGQRGELGALAEWINIINDNTVEADVAAMEFKNRMMAGWDTSGVTATADAFDIVGAKAWAAKRNIDAAQTAATNFRPPDLSQATDWGPIDERLRGARLQAEWAKMDARNRARAAARAKKKSDRVNAVTNAKGRIAQDRRASARTGTHFAASVAAAKAGCS
jgi:hypothetical protein